MAIRVTLVPYEPVARFMPYYAVINGELFMWGGKDENPSVEVYNPCLEAWRQELTHGTPPLGVCGGTSAHSQHYLYHYGGGMVKNFLTGSLHRLDTRTATWTKLSGHCPGAPMKKQGCGMVVYGNSAIIIGGIGIRNGPVQPGSEWSISDEDNEDDPNTEGSTNEMHKYDLKEGTWSSIMCTGTRPPPCFNFSFTMINNHQVVLFGGNETTDLYILDLVKMDWSKIPSAGGKSFVWRHSHAAVCMDYGDRPRLLIVGGMEADDKVLNDVWITDIKSGRWRKIPVPNLKPRYGHCAGAFCLSPGITEVVLFGGSRIYPGDVIIAETTVLRFERDTSDPQSEWRLTDVADNTQLGINERIIKKMTRLSQLTHDISRSKQEVEKRLQEVEREKKEAERRSAEAERRVQNVQRQQLDSELRAQDLEG